MKFYAKSVNTPMKFLELKFNPKQFKYFISDTASNINKTVTLLLKSSAKVSLSYHKYNLLQDKNSPIKLKKINDRNI